MVIIETSIFTRHVQELLSDEEYRELQIALVQRPAAGRSLLAVAAYVNFAGQPKEKASAGAHGSSTTGLSRKTNCSCCSSTARVSKKI